MRELGYVEGRTVVFEARGADGKPERLPALAAELVRLKVDVIVASTTPAVQAARQAAATIPIVMSSGDPLSTRLVTNLARPGGSVTGLTTLSVELSAKRLELAGELVPGASRLAILGTEAATTTGYVRETEAAARALGLRLHVVRVRSPGELDGAFATIARGRPAALLVIPGPMFFGERRRLAELALKHRLPTVSGQRDYAEAGGLIAYGTKLTELFRRAAVYVDKILKGARPGDLPVEQPTRFELAVNLKTAKALGLTIPPSVLLRADETIQ
jgi:putative ABC transport system substrate-binding protein